MSEAREPTCVEADPSEGGFVWVEATEATPSGEIALAFWLRNEVDSKEAAYRLIGPAWMRETDAVVFFGGDQAWEECREDDPGARKFWKLSPHPAREI